MTPSHIYGVVQGKVTDNNDPDKEGKVRVRYPWMGGNDNGYWAPVGTIMSGGNRGFWFMPQVDDDVLVAFDQGDVTHPYIVGFLWNGEDKPPSTDPAIRIIRSLNGHQIEISDRADSPGDVGYIRMLDAYGNMVELGNAHMTLYSVGTLWIEAANIVVNGRVVATAPSPI